MLSNFVAFQTGWFSCVLGAANGMPWWALVVIPIVLWNIQKSRSASAEIVLDGSRVRTGNAQGVIQAGANDA